MITEDEDMKEKFIIFLSGNDISHITKFDSDEEMEVIKTTISKSNAKTAIQLVEELEKANIIETIIEPSSRFLVIKL